MDFTTVWNCQKRSIWLVVAIYPDRHYFIHWLREEQHLDFDHSTLANVRILLAESRKDAERLAIDLGPEWTRVTRRL